MVSTYNNMDFSLFQKRLTAAAATEIAGTKEAVLDTIFGKRIAGLSKAKLADAYVQTEMNERTDGKPNTFYGMFNGITRLSQIEANTNARHEMDRAALKLLELCPV